MHPVVNVRKILIDFDLLAVPGNICVYCYCDHNSDRVVITCTIADGFPHCILDTPARLCFSDTNLIDVRVQ